MKITELSVAAFLALWFVFAGVSPLKAQGQDEARNVQLTNQAWDAFNKGQYQRAIDKAQECISEFVGAADRLEKTLKAQDAAPPPTGKVNEKQKEAIHANGLLNDVATCFYIKGRSLEATHHIAEAKEAYKAAMKYEYARTWDRHGWFWSPAEGASDRLAMLDK